jgi:hypothetical protein
MLFAKIDQAASGAVVNPVANKKVRVVALSLVVASAVTVRLDSSGGTALTGAMSLIVGVPLTLPFAPHMNQGRTPAGYTETLAGEGLSLTLGAGVQVSGLVVYELVP